MRPNSVKRALKAGQPSVGTWLSHRVVERSSQRLAPRAVDEPLPPLQLNTPLAGEQR